MLRTSFIFISIDIVSQYLNFIFMFRSESTMLTIKIVFYFAFILNLSTCLPIEPKSNLTVNEFLNYTPVLVQTETNLTSDDDYNNTISSNLKPKLTFDEFFDYTTFSDLTFSPTGQYLLFQTQRPSWNTSLYEHNLWLYEIATQQKTLIITGFESFENSQWSPSGNWIALVLNQKLASNISKDPHCENESLSENSDASGQHFYLYSIESNGFCHIRTGKQTHYPFAWSHNDSSIYFVNNELSTIRDNDSFEWKDVIQYRPQNRFERSIIHRINIEIKNNTLSTKTNLIKNVPFWISELLFVPFEEKLIFSSNSTSLKNSDAFEIYSLDLQNSSLLTRLTNNTMFEYGLKLSSDYKNVLFQTSIRLNWNKEKSGARQSELFVLNLTNGQIDRFGKLMDAHITEYTPASNGSVYILGQAKIQVHIFSKNSTTDDWIYHRGWEGTYQSIASSSNPNCSIAFVHSSSKWPMEICCANNINDLSSAKVITNDNELFTQRNLPETK
jgi:hypothetical protein